MEKKSLKLKAATVVMMSSTALALCLTAGCGHAFTDEWTYDETNHWHACVEPDCNEKLNEGAHVDENKDGKCDVCQYVLVAPHEHVYDGGWQKSDAKHWKECTADGCTNPKAKSQEGNHVYDDDSDATCNTCGYERHLHVFGGDWINTDADKHWKECTADGCTDPKATTDPVDHVYDNKRDDTCNTCGYVRTLPLTDEAEKFKSDVQALGEINENSVARIDEAISGLKADYDALDDIDKANETVIAVKAELDEKETAVETFKTNAASAVAALKAEVDKINGTAEATEEYYDELEELHEQIKALGTYSKTLWNAEDTDKVKDEITRVVRLLALIDTKNEIDATVDSTKVITANAESKTYYNSLLAIKEKINGLYLKDFWAENYAESNTKLENEITRVVTAIVSAIKAEVDKIDGTAEATETYLVSLKDISAQIEDLDETCKALWNADDTTKLQTEITRVTQIIELTPYKEAIEATVDTNKVIAADDASKAYYAALKKIRDDIAEVEGDLKTVWGTAFAEYDAKLNNEITRVVTTVIDTEKEDAIFGLGGNGNVNIVRVYYNLFGDIIEFATAPSVVYTVNDGNENTVTLTLNEGAYVGQVPFNATQQNNIVYTVGEETAQTLNLAAFKANIYLTIVKTETEFTTAFSNEDKLTINNIYTENDAKTYVYIYLADEIDIGSIENDAPISISGLSLGKVEVSNGMTREELYKAIARQHSEFIDKELEVRFVFISENEEEIGEEDNKQTVWVQTAVNNAAVSERITLALTIEDTKDRLSFGNAGTVINNKGNVTPGAAWSNNDLVEQFNSYTDISSANPVTADNVHEHLRYIVDVTLNGETKSFSVDCVKGGSINQATMQANMFALFKESVLGEKEYTVTLSLALRENSVYNAVLRQSFARVHTAKIILNLPGNECQVGFSGDNFTFGIVSGKDRGSVFNFGVAYVELNFAKGKDKFTAYFFPEGNNLRLYSNVEQEGESFSCATVTNGWWGINGFNNWVMRNYEVDTFNAKLGWAFSTIAVYDGEYGGKTNGGESDSIYHDSWDPNQLPKLPGNECQVQFSGGGTGDFMEFGITPAGSRGSVFDFGVAYVELKFVNGSETYTAYFLAEKGQLGMYTDADGSGTRLGWDTVTNGYTTIDGFNAWVRNNYDVDEEFDVRQGWELTTKAVYDDEYDGKTDGGESAPIVHGSWQ